MLDSGTLRDMANAVLAWASLGGGSNVYLTVTENFISEIVAPVGRPKASKYVLASKSVAAFSVSVDRTSTIFANSVSVCMGVGGSELRDDVIAGVETVGSGVGLFLEGMAVVGFHVVGLHVVELHVVG
jgi:hypothetical protein